MAITFGIVPFTVEEVELCINAIFDNWLERFGGDSSYELKTMIDDLRKLCIEQQHSRFCNAEQSLEERINLPREKAGYWHKEKNEFWIFQEVFKREVLKGKDNKVFNPLLVKEGYLKKEEDMGYETKRQPKRESRQRFIVINVAALLGEYN
jgi:uncharacterized protein (DUF927 family)